MYTGTVWGFTLIILGFLLSLGAAQLMVSALFPGLVAQAAHNLEKKPVRVGLLGLVPAIAIFLLFAGFANGGGGVKFFTAMILFPSSVLLAGGLGAVSLVVGRRLPSPSDEARPWRGLIRGALTTELAYVLPFVGWLFVLPVSAVAGLGATFAALFQKTARRDAAWELVMRPAAATTVPAVVSVVETPEPGAA